MVHDVFVSHASEDRDAATAICEALEAERVSCWIAPRDIPSGTGYGPAIIDAITECRIFLLLLSQAANASGFVFREAERAASKGRQIVMVRLEDVEPNKALELFVSATHWHNVFGKSSAEYLPGLVGSIRTQLLDTRPAPGTAQAFAAATAVMPDGRTRHDAAAGLVDSHAPEIGREPQAPPVAVAPVQSAAVKRKVVLVYKRRASPDDQVLTLLETQLSGAGHHLFIDRHLTIGVQWAAQIEKELKSADAVVALLSGDSVRSEMLAYELQVAHQAAQTNGGRPNIFPVRIKFEGRLPNELAPILEPIQYFSWRGPTDNTKLVADLLAAFDAPPVSSKVRLEPVGGAMPLNAEFYIERSTDEQFRAAVERRDAIVLLNGARQMGKTSLLARGNQKARASGVKVVLTDFQSLTAAQFSSLDSLYLGLADRIVDQLGMDIDPRESWRPALSPNDNFERFLKRKVLSSMEGHLLWAMDEVDRLFSLAFGAEVFGLLRSWYNARATDPAAPWGRLTMAIAYATEAHLFITDPNQSPFNVGTRLLLEDFTREQVRELNQRHGSPLRSDEELATLYGLIGGQPYLNRRALYEMVGHGIPLAVFKDCVDRDDGPFGDHLRRLLVLLAPNAPLMAAVREIIAGRPCPTSDAFFRLRAGGLATGASREDCRLRCRIYESYLRRHMS